MVSALMWAFNGHEIKAYIFAVTDWATVLVNTQITAVFIVKYGDSLDEALDMVIKQSLQVTK